MQFQTLAVSYFFKFWGLEYTGKLATPPHNVAIWGLHVEWRVATS